MSRTSALLGRTHLSPPPSPRTSCSTGFILPFFAPADSQQHTLLQPPLSYYIGVINNRDWNQVDIVTYRADEQDENPVVPALRMMANIGTWPSMDINIHVVRKLVDVWRCIDKAQWYPTVVGALDVVWDIGSCMLGRARILRSYLHQHRPPSFIGFL